MAKLLVNVADGTIEIEGDEKFVLSAFDQVRSALKEMSVSPVASPKGNGSEINKPAADDPDTVGSKAKSPSHKTKASKPHQPTLNANLDTSGLAEFLALYNSSKNTERILVFAAFLREKLSLTPCNSDDIFSCFHSMKSSMKIPEAFAKNMNDAKAAGYINYSKLSEISIPIMGENHLVNLAKKVTE